MVLDVLCGDFWRLLPDKDPRNAQMKFFFSVLLSEEQMLVIRRVTEHPLVEVEKFAQNLTCEG